PMLDVATSKPSSPDSAPITYIESPAAPLGVESVAFDFVVCQQGLQFFLDRLAALSEMRRALKPSGQLAIATWSRIEENALYAALHAALRETVPADLADRLLAPFGGPDVKALKDTVEAAGFQEVRARNATLPLISEGGIAQAARSLEASPLAPPRFSSKFGQSLPLASFCLQASSGYEHLSLSNFAVVFSCFSSLDHPPKRCLCCCKKNLISIKLHFLITTSFSLVDGVGWPRPAYIRPRYGPAVSHRK